MTLLNLVTAPSALISTADAKTHLRVVSSDDDSYIDGLVAAATAEIDGPYGTSGKALVTQRWSWAIAPVTGRYCVNFPVVPLQSVVSITYFDRDNASQSLSVDDFTIYTDEDTARIVPDIGTSWPAMYDREDALTIVADCGFGTAADVPANLIHAAKVMISYLYENRGENRVDPPSAVGHLVGLSRLGWVGS